MMDKTRARAWAYRIAAEVLRRAKHSVDSQTVQRVRAVCAKDLAPAIAGWSDDWGDSVVAFSPSLFDWPRPGECAGCVYATAHELGHAMGLVHQKDPRSLMYPALIGSMNATDVQQFCSIWYTTECRSVDTDGGLWPDPAP